MTYQFGCYRSSAPSVYRAKCVSVSHSRTTVTSRDPKILAEINKLERDLFGFSGDRLQQKSTKSSSSGETDVSMPSTEKLSTTDDTKTKTNGLTSTGGSLICSSTTEPKSDSKENVKTTAIFPKRSFAKSHSIETGEKKLIKVVRSTELGNRKTS
ncbi:hypothetical protein M3Y94_01248100 [Aphelenchoides besseyi]|nr:hypothetical protein M3Y94_01248100 [Aphelenchoides besseyi]